MGNKTPKERRDHLDCLAPLGEPLNIFEQENYKSKRDWTARNSMSLQENWVNPKQMNDGNRHLGTGKWKESKARLSLQKDRE